MEAVLLLETECMLIASGQLRGLVRTGHTRSSRPYVRRDSTKRLAASKDGLDRAEALLHDEIS